MRPDPPPTWPQDAWDPTRDWRPDPAFGAERDDWSPRGEGPRAPAPAPRRPRRGRRLLVAFAAAGVLVLAESVSNEVWSSFEEDSAAAGAAASSTVAPGAAGRPGAADLPSGAVGARDSSGAEVTDDVGADPDTGVVAAPDSDGDGVADVVDAYPDDASRHSAEDRDGDGAMNAVDVAPDDPGTAAWPKAVVSHVVDGDTVDVQGYGRVRLIGMDAPEAGECGYEHATDIMTYLVLGKEISLVPGARDDRDTYDRLLRYIDVGGKDAGRELIGSGWAIARYDSRDGYGWHPREADYVALDALVPDRTCPRPPPAPAPAPAPAVRASSAEPWNQPGPDLDCSDIRRKVRIIGPDYHRLDRDNDGWGCESYG